MARRCFCAPSLVTDAVVRLPQGSPRWRELARLPSHAKGAGSSVKLQKDEPAFLSRCLLFGVTFGQLSVFCNADFMRVQQE